MNKLTIDIQGLGIFFYSEHAVKKIKKGEDFFTNNYDQPNVVEKLAVDCQIAGVCLGSSGSYLLLFKKRVSRG